MQQIFTKCLPSSLEFFWSCCNCNFGVFVLGRELCNRDELSAITDLNKLVVFFLARKML